MIGKKKKKKEEEAKRQRARDGRAEVGKLGTEEKARSAERKLEERKYQYLVPFLFIPLRGPTAQTQLEQATMIGEYAQAAGVTKQD